LGEKKKEEEEMVLSVKEFWIFLEKKKINSMFLAWDQELDYSLECIELGNIRIIFFIISNEYVLHNQTPSIQGWLCEEKK
jgi:hypothetical protein